MNVRSFLWFICYFEINFSLLIFLFEMCFANDIIRNFNPNFYLSFTANLNRRGTLNFSDSKERDVHREISDNICRKEI